jgi:hypothetical protein
MRGATIARDRLWINRKRQLGFIEYIARHRPTWGIQLITSGNYNTERNMNRGVHIDKNNLPG